MAGLGVVAVLAPPHRAVELAGDRALRRVPLGQVMIGPREVLAGGEPPRLEGQMPRSVSRHSGELGGIVDRAVTVATLQEPLGMDVEGAGQVRPCPPGSGRSS